MTAADRALFLHVHATFYLHGIFVEGHEQVQGNRNDTNPLDSFRDVADQSGPKTSGSAFFGIWTRILDSKYQGKHSWFRSAVEGKDSIACNFSGI